MEIINLDKFAKVQKVQYQGKEYNISGMTVQQFLEDSDIGKLDDEKTSVKEKIAIMVNAIEKQSDFDRETLMKMPFSVLDALIMVSQGEDPNKEINDKKKSLEDEDQNKE